MQFRATGLSAALPAIGNWQKPRHGNGLYIDCYRMAQPVEPVMFLPGIQLRKSRSASRQKVTLPSDDVNAALISVHT